jgi:hypothetical protein
MTNDYVWSPDYTTDDTPHFIVSQAADIGSPRLTQEKMCFNTSSTISPPQTIEFRQHLTKILSMFQPQVSLLYPSPATPGPSFRSGSEDGGVVVEGLIVSRNHQARSTDDTVIRYSYGVVDASARRYGVEVANRGTFDACARVND